jgi:hypothetical protein
MRSSMLLRPLDSLSWSFSADPANPCRRISSRRTPGCRVSRQRSSRKSHAVTRFPLVVGGHQRGPFKAYERCRSSVRGELDSGPTSPGRATDRRRRSASPAHERPELTFTFVIGVTAGAVLSFQFAGRDDRALEVGHPHALAESAPGWVSGTSLALALFAIGLAGARVVPAAKRLGARTDDSATQSRVARDVFRDHVLCLAAIAAVLGVQIAGAH